MNRVICWPLATMLLGLIGCLSYPAMQTTSLGQVTLSPQSELFQASFSYPQEFFSGLTLVFHDGKGNQREFSAHPDWPLVLSVEIRDKNTGQVLLVREITKGQMQYTNWHDTSTSVLLNFQPGDYDKIGPGREYLILINTITPDEKRPEGEIFGNWAQSFKVTRW